MSFEKRAVADAGSETTPWKDSPKVEDISGEEVEALTQKIKEKL